jgi:3-methyladenine DNA glycosylase AlkD
MARELGGDPGMTHPLVTALRRELKRRGDPLKSGPMQAYMKSAMPFHGVPAPVQKEIHRSLFPQHILPDFESWYSVCLEIWRSARFREERYAAIGLTGYRAYDSYQTLETLPLYEEMITTGAWWDYVDGIASGRLGLLLSRFPAPMKKTMRAWSRSEDLWKRRSSILCQLRFKGETDRKLLYACIEANLADPEFFIKKAIGWALREYAWTDPAEVLRYVRERETELSALSRREATKNLQAPRRG